MVLAVHVTRPELLEGVAEVFDCWAYDEWWDDPARDPSPQSSSKDALERLVAEVVAEASR